MSSEQPKEGFAVVEGSSIHFTEQGTGFPLLLVHGAFSSGTQFLQSPLGVALSERFRVIAPDSLAHGLSDAPSDPALYDPAHRAAHLVAVLDALSIDRAHVIGYSMGGWMASALAAFNPERLASLTIGGWDVVRGMYTPAAAWGLPEITYDILNGLVRTQRPDLLAGIRPGAEAGMRAAVDAMNTLSGLAEAVASLNVPVALWMGTADLYYAAAEAFAKANNIPLLSVPGDHLTAIEVHGREAAQRLIDFIEGPSSSEKGQ